MEAKILIVEDDVFTCENVNETFTAAGYEVEMAHAPEEAIRQVKSFNPDLILMDIDLKSDIDGIELASKINQRGSIPIMYLTDKKDERIIEKAKNVHHAYYTTKPFDYPVLLSDVALILKQEARKKTRPVINGLFVKDQANKTTKRKVEFDQIYYIKACRAYSEIYVKQGKGNKPEKMESSKSMKEVMQNLPSSLFMQVHRSYVVNVNMIDSCNTTDLVVGDTTIPIGDHYKASVLEVLNQV